ncbi:spore protease YyaC [Bacillus sp. FJAT-27264]|uniref:spore protease YyaC n=1 Tax=Paenibacillus sp. (strain DSM 101736 / FJAT-27264) TaxID=1850362 RepID=UPI000807E968|nr:spore protease YyaC [Bacillus sp. FJAT-27264]OBZ16242.1 spore protease YyaC [Bacillus sp. FJAT-27264]
MGIREQENGRRYKKDAEGLTAFFREIAALHAIEQVTFLCIGTDRSTGDSLGPLTGSRLLDYGFPHVVGTLPNPCDADNLAVRVASIPPGQIIIAVDACLGTLLTRGSYLAAVGPLQPAQSVGLKFPAVGHYSIAAIVDVNGPKPYHTLQTTPLHRVMIMAEQIAGAAATGFGLEAYGRFKGSSLA